MTAHEPSRPATTLEGWSLLKHDAVRVVDGAPRQPAGALADATHQEALQRVGRRSSRIAGHPGRASRPWAIYGLLAGIARGGRYRGGKMCASRGSHGRPGRGSTLPASPAESNDMSVRYDRQSERDVPTVKMTLRLEPEVATILRGVAADFGLAQHEAASLLAKWFVRTAGHQQQRIVFDGPVAERIEAAVADWRRRLERAGTDAGSTNEGHLARG